MKIYSETELGVIRNQWDIHLLHNIDLIVICLCFCAGLAVASALVDVSQQMCVGYKEKSGGLRNRKQQPTAQPSTCI